MNSFYIFLPSNVNDFNYTNTIGNYITKLPISVDLDGDWEVGLSEIIITKTWFNLFKNNALHLQTKKGTINESCSFPSACYMDIKHLLNEVQRCMDKITKNFKS